MFTQDQENRIVGIVSDQLFKKLAFLITLILAVFAGLYILNDRMMSSLEKSVDALGRKVDTLQSTVLQTRADLQQQERDLAEQRGHIKTLRVYTALNPDIKDPEKKQAAAREAMDQTFRHIVWYRIVGDNIYAFVYTPRREEMLTLIATDKKMALAQLSKAMPSTSVSFADIATVSTLALGASLTPKNFDATAAYLLYGADEHIGRALEKMGWKIERNAKVPSYERWPDFVKAYDERAFEKY